jgi:hypothetical protein
MACSGCAKRRAWIKEKMSKLIHKDKPRAYDPTKDDSKPQWIRGGKVKQ